MPGQTRPAPRRDRRGHDTDERHRRNREAQQIAYQAARVVLERAASRRDAEWKAAAEANRRRALVLLSLPAVIGIVVMAIGVVFLPLLVVGGALFVVWTIVAAMTWVGSGASLLGRIGGLAPAAAAEAGVVSPLLSERFSDLTEGLCTVLGLPVPQLRILDDAAPNAISVGRQHHDAAVVVTSGLLERLDRIELEGVLAHELAHVKRLDIVSATVAASSVGHSLLSISGARTGAWMAGADREIRGDVAGVATTRYPPGLISALDGLTEVGDCRPSLAPELLARTSDAWLVPFGPVVGTTLGDRLDVLREL